MSYANLVEKLSTLLKPVTDEGGGNAAVVLLLKKTGRSLLILVVRRAENPEDPWSGQIGLPGGKRDLKDQSLKATVIRETLEETGINLFDGCRFLGVMEALRSMPKPELKILPFVVLLEREQSLRLSAELQGFAWISLEELAKRKDRVRYSFGEFPAYVVGDLEIWGLTYRILERFIQILDALS